MEDLQLICITGFGVLRKKQSMGFYLMAAFFSMRDLVRDKNKN
jgi:hypothetical protein